MSKKYGSIECFLRSRCFHKNAKISTRNAVLELLVEFFQDSIGLNCGLEFRNILYNIQIKNFCMFGMPDKQEQTSVYRKMYFQQDLLFSACIIYHI